MLILLMSSSDGKSTDSPSNKDFKSAPSKEPTPLIEGSSSGIFISFFVSALLLLLLFVFLDLPIRRIMMVTTVTIPTKDL